MISDIDYENLIKNYKNYILIDLRSPLEFSEGTIPSAINIPILNNEERALVGTKYRQEGKEEAKKLGLEIVARKLSDLYREIYDLKEKYSNLVFFCSRGGYRSSILVSFLKSFGIEAQKLKGGYKAYRAYLLKELPLLVNSTNFIVLYGNTGTGKTRILKKLSQMGHDTLDLEACANHRGSILGSVGLGEQNSQKKFESLIFHSLLQKKSNRVFIEGESRRIGKNIVPLYLHDAMKKGANLKISAPLDLRVENILKDYVHDTDDELIQALNHLIKYLGKKKIDNYISLIKSKNYRPIIRDLIINYYDPMYEHNIREYKAKFHYQNPLDTARDISDWISRIETLD